MGTRTVSQMINLQTPDQTSKYITDITEKGITIHPKNTSENKYLQINSDGIDIINDNESLASFAIDGITIGTNNGTQSYLFEDYHSLQLFDKEVYDLRNSPDFDPTVSYKSGDYVKYEDDVYQRKANGNPGAWNPNQWNIVSLDPYLFISDLRNKNNEYTYVDNFIGDGETTTFSLTYTASNHNYTVHTSNDSGGHYTLGISSIIFNFPPDEGTTIEATYTTQERYVKAYTLGFRKAHSTIGGMSIAEGFDITAKGRYSHAEGWNTTANGKSSHAEGYGTIANGDNSHAGGFSTTANYNNQTVIGRYNNSQSSSVFEIGNGTYSTPSNALTVDWNGKVECGDYSGNFKSIFNIFYPKGSYYETHLPSRPSGAVEPFNPSASDLEALGDTGFDPNYAWGGTWVLDSAGKVTVAYDSSDTDFDTIGDSGGSKTHMHTTGDFTLQAAHIPAHTHNSKTITASFSGRRCGNDAVSHWGGTNTTVTASSTANTTATTAGTANKHTDIVNFSMAHTHDSVGGGQAHNHGNTGNESNVQPYVVVNRWHRTA